MLQELGRQIPPWSATGQGLNLRTEGRPWQEEQSTRAMMKPQVGTGIKLGDAGGGCQLSS
eukprot:3565064-Prorocentrum_lima.AAC.1